VVVSQFANVVPPGHGLKLSAQERVSPVWTLHRFESPRPVTIPYRAVAGQKVLRERSKALVDGVGRARRTGG